MDLSNLEVGTAIPNLASSRGEQENARLFVAFVAMARMVEDLTKIVEEHTEALVKKNLINFADLPASAQQKLIIRRQDRAGLEGIVGLVDEDNLDL